MQILHFCGNAAAENWNLKALNKETIVGFTFRKGMHLKVQYFTKYIINACKRSNKCRTLPV